MSHDYFFAISTKRDSSRVSCKPCTFVLRLRDKSYINYTLICFLLVMLGMMNSPANSVELYSTNNALKGQISEQDRKTFTEVKDKPVVSYTEDGRKMINGKLEDTDRGNGSNLWSEVLMRSAVRFNIKEYEDVEEQKNEDSDNQGETKVGIVEEAVVANSVLTKP
uniref:LPS export ABC transporter periplasmic protein LptC n=1 Tax=Heterorhabditis bacteriophora TaxID=37862 RepID=A0A1I7XTX2_HETBA